jgi:2',3'-cyclic-nucleotide 2'-phosphodiesterase (5'-nucleotidase family)
VSESVRSGGARSRLAVGDGADLVILYGGEQEGILGSCGCDSRPRGSLARVDGYRRLLERAEPEVPLILLNTGAWLDNTIGYTLDLRADAKVANIAMVKAVELGRWDVLNATFRDMPWFREAEIPANVVSANIRPLEDGLGPAPYIVVESGAVRVAVTGLSSEGMSFIQPDTHRPEDPVRALEALLPEMREDADLVVVLGYHLGSLATKVIKLDVDVLIDANMFKEQHEPMMKYDTLWLRSRWRTERLGELRLFLDDGKISGARDRMIDLDERIPATRSLQRLERQVKAEQDRVLHELFGAQMRDDPDQRFSVANTSY